MIVTVVVDGDGGGVTIIAVLAGGHGVGTVRGWSSCSSGGGKCGRIFTMI